MNISSQPKEKPMAIVLTSRLKPLKSCHPATARYLLDNGIAAVLNAEPFTLILLGEAKDDNRQVHTAQPSA